MAPLYGPIKQKNLVNGISSRCGADDLQGLKSITGMISCNSHYVSFQTVFKKYHKKLESERECCYVIDSF